MEKRSLETYSTRELVAELKRRMAELDEARALLGGNSSGKNPRISGAKLAYWSAWHKYRAEHPEATIEEWRKLKRKR